MLVSAGRSRREQRSTVGQDCEVVNPSRGDRCRAEMRGGEVVRGRGAGHGETCGQVPNGARLKKHAGARRRNHRRGIRNAGVLAAVGGAWRGYLAAWRRCASNVLWR